MSTLTESLDSELTRNKRTFELSDDLIPAADLASLTKQTGSEIAPYKVVKEGGNVTTKYRLGFKTPGQFIRKLLGMETSAFVITNYPLHTHDFEIPNSYRGKTFNMDKHKGIIESEFGLSPEDLKFMGKDEKRFIVFNDGNVLVHNRYGLSKILDDPENIVFQINENYTVKAMRLKGT